MLLAAKASDSTRWAQTGWVIEDRHKGGWAEENLHQEADRGRTKALLDTRMSCTEQRELCNVSLTGGMWLVWSADLPGASARCTVLFTLAARQIQCDITGPGSHENEETIICAKWRTPWKNTPPPTTELSIRMDRTTISPLLSWKRVKSLVDSEKLISWMCTVIWFKRLCEVNYRGLKRKKKNHNRKKCNGRKGDSESGCENVLRIEQWPPPRPCHYLGLQWT